jgi:hypothetical protein
VKQLCGRGGNRRCRRRSRGSPQPREGAGCFAPMGIDPGHWVPPAPKAVHIPARVGSGKAMSEDDIAMIIVHTEDWDQADDERRQRYTDAAQAAGIDIAVRDFGPQGKDFVYVERRGPARGLDAPRHAVFHDGPVGCGAARWEHALRPLLGLDDPCRGTL